MPTKRLILIGLLLTLTLAPGVVLAHSGSGVPYVFINGQPTQANPIAGSYADLPQDFGAQPYSVNQSLECKVDQTQIMAKAFRWQWSAGDSSEGATKSHAFSKAGTYVVMLQAKDDASGNWLDIDPVAVNVVPAAGYMLPSAKVKISTIRQTSGGATIKFEATAQTDKSAKITQSKWQFGDGGKGQGQTVQHSYQGSQLSLFPRLSITDSNGLTADVIFELDINNKSVRAFDLPALPGVVQGSASAAADSQPPWTAIGVGLLAAAAVLVLIWSRHGRWSKIKPTKRRKN